MVQRDENGRFIKGHGGGPGRPPKKREERFLEVTLSAVTYDDWKEIVKRAKQQAKMGDATARKWLSDYLIGPPTQKIEQQNSGEQRLLIEYVNDWRGDDEDTST